MAIILSFLFSFSAFASNCEYFIENDLIEYEGYAVNFGSYLEKQMNAKDYHRVFTNDVPEMKIAFHTENRRYFQFAVVDVKWGNLAVKADKRCYTELCAISDVASVTREGIDQMIRKLTKCD